MIREFLRRLRLAWQCLRYGRLLEEGPVDVLGLIEHHTAEDTAKKAVVVYQTRDYREHIAYSGPNSGRARRAFDAGKASPKVRAATLFVDGVRRGSYDEIHNP